MEAGLSRGLGVGVEMFVLLIKMGSEILEARMDFRALDSGNKRAMMRDGSAMDMIRLTRFEADLLPSRGRGVTGG